jgi:ubiquinone/menaquinone biosynthesis C-methylase UbiE
MTRLRENSEQAVVVRPIDALIEFLGVGHGRLLDIGCGAGTLGEELLQRGYDVIGIDPFKERGLRGRRLQAGAEAIPLKNESFDIALFHWSLHHLPQERMADALLEARRLLKKMGAIVVIEPEPVGTWQDVSQSFHDETTVQAMAAQAVNAMVEKDNYQIRTRYYLSEDCYESFDRFVDDMCSLAYNRYSEIQVRQPDVQKAFESCWDDSIYRLRQRIRMEELSLSVAEGSG